MAAGKPPAGWSRFFRRLWRPFLSREEEARIAALIGEMEAHTTGEIHVHIASRFGSGEILELASRKFKELGLDKTVHRNGVLILVSHLDHRFAIWGDEGIHEKAGRPLWERAAKALTGHFAQRRHAEGIEACVREVGRELALYFPKEPGPGRDQLPNEVTGS